MFISISVIELSKEYVINADVKKVWGFLTDLQQLTGCIPNLENVQIESPTKFKGKIKPPFSFIKGKLGIESEIVKFNGTDGFTATMKGSSIGASFQGTVNIAVLAAEGTKIQIGARVETYGLLKTIPKSLIYKVVEDVETPMLRCIKEKLEGHI